MTTERVYADGHPHDLEVKPVTLLCHQGGIRIDVPGRIEISPEYTVKVADRMTDDDLTALWQSADGRKLWGFVFTDREPPATMQGAPLDVRHVVGMIVCIYLAVVHGKGLFFRCPETYLHPRNQVGLADLFIYLSNGGKQ